MKSNAQRSALIINADDFGYSVAVNEAVIKAHREGVLTSASLMVNEEGAADAILRAREHPSLAVGLHLSLVLGKATLAHAEIPHLVDSPGNFSRSPLRAGLKYFFSPMARKELRREMHAQFERFAATGLSFSHVDGHNHLHMHPVVFRELIALCEEFGVRRVRIVDGDNRAHAAVSGRLRLSEKVTSRVFRALSRHCHRRLDGRSFVVPGSVHGLLHSGQIDEPYLLALLPQISKDATTEIYLHPTSLDAPDWERKNNAGGSRELDALVSPRVRLAIENHGFRLATYSTI